MSSGLRSTVTAASAHADESTRPTATPPCLPQRAAQSLRWLRSMSAFRLVCASSVRRHDTVRNYFSRVSRLWVTIAGNSRNRIFLFFYFHELGSGFWSSPVAPNSLLEPCRADGSPLKSGGTSDTLLCCRDLRFCDARTDPEHGSRSIQFWPSAERKFAARLNASWARRPTTKRT